jgi:hypothetical protein
MCPSSRTYSVSPVDKAIPYQLAMSNGSHAVGVAFCSLTMSHTFLFRPRKTSKRKVPIMILDHYYKPSEIT